ncbi:hypothetical protein ABH944_007275 [Caballeronia udeis]|uniref:Uncharacterized protein n=1 Tax=Caballeronia udeis TaxID=1232866 RepID=A0ABW8MWZ7_9BURK
MTNAWSLKPCAYTVAQDAGKARSFVAKRRGSLDTVRTGPLRQRLW